MISIDRGFTQSPDKATQVVHEPAKRRPVLEITRLGGGADRASLANSAFQDAYTSADRDMYPSAAPSHRGPSLSKRGGVHLDSKK